MKNELEQWETGLSDRLKEHEFDFDPQALAGFEALLTAEATVPDPATQPVPVIATGLSTLFKAGFIVSLLLVVSGSGYLLLYPNEVSSPRIDQLVPLPAVPPSVSLTEKPTVDAAVNQTGGGLRTTTVTSSPRPSLAASNEVQVRKKLSKTAPPELTIAHSAAVNPGKLPPFVSPPNTLPPAISELPQQARRPTWSIAPIRVKLPLMRIDVPQRTLPQLMITPATETAASRRRLRRLRKKWDRP